MVTFCVGFGAGGFSQSKKPSIYSTYETEIIFSFANLESTNQNADNIMRWSPVFNIMGFTHKDFGNAFGIFAGLGMRNVGFIASFPDSGNNERTKFRTYNLGLPLGFKIGKMDDDAPKYFYAGAEAELPFHYKEKQFVDGNRENKISAWFTDRTPLLTFSVFAGFTFNNGASLKAKYYLTNFFNSDYILYAEGPNGERIETKPFGDISANVFYFAFTFDPFRSMRKEIQRELKGERDIYISTMR